MRKKVLCTLISVVMTTAMLAGYGGDPQLPIILLLKKQKKRLHKDTQAEADTSTEASGDTIVVGFSQVGANLIGAANTQSMKSTFTEENGYTLLFDDAKTKIKLSCS